MAALSGTLLVVYQICATEHDIFSSPEVTLAFFQNELLVPFSIVPSLINSWYSVFFFVLSRAFGYEIKK